MKPILLITTMFLSAALIPVTARAQNDADYKNWMKQVNDTNGKLRKDLKSKSADAVSDANKMAEIFTQVGAFWQKRNVEDGVKLAADATSGFNTVGGFASDGKFDDASAEQKSTEATCAGCHKVHRTMTIHGPEIK